MELRIYLVYWMTELTAVNYRQNEYNMVWCTSNIFNHCCLLLPNNSFLLIFFCLKNTDIYCYSLFEITSIYYYIFINTHWAWVWDETEGSMIPFAWSENFTMYVCVLLLALFVDGLNGLAGLQFTVCTSQCDSRMTLHILRNTL